MKEELRIASEKLAKTIAKNRDAEVADAVYRRRLADRAAQAWSKMELDYTDPSFRARLTGLPR